jgi:hypothetical protein
MLLTSVIVVLREVLESALLVSVLVALSGTLGISRRWVMWALGLGLAGAVGFSLGFNTISDWFDGVGMEVVSAFMQGIIYLLLVAFALLVLWNTHSTRTGSLLIRMIMVLIVALAVAREGVEVLIHRCCDRYQCRRTALLSAQLSGDWQVTDHRTGTAGVYRCRPAVTGGTIADPGRLGALSSAAVGHH